MPALERGGKSTLTRSLPGREDGDYQGPYFQVTFFTAGTGDCITFKASVMVMRHAQLQ